MERILIKNDRDSFMARLLASPPRQEGKCWCNYGTIHTVSDNPLILAKEGTAHYPYHHDDIALTVVDRWLGSSFANHTHNNHCFGKKEKKSHWEFGFNFC